MRVGGFCARGVFAGLVLAVSLVLLMPQAEGQSGSAGEDYAVGEALEQVPGRVLSVRSHRADGVLRYEVRILSNASHVRTVTVPAQRAGLETDVVSGGQAVEVLEAPAPASH